MADFNAIYYARLSSRLGWASQPSQPGEFGQEFIKRKLADYREKHGPEIDGNTLDRLIGQWHAELRQIVGQVFEELENEGLIYDSGERREGVIVWKARPRRLARSDLARSGKVWR